MPDMCLIVEEAFLGLRKILCKAYLHVILAEPKERKMREVVTTGFPVREKWARSSSYLLLFSRCTLLIATGSSIVTFTSAMIVFIGVSMTKSDITKTLFVVVCHF